MVTKLERVLVRRPEEASCEHWLEYGWRSAPNFAKLLKEHDALCALLESAGTEVVYGGPVPSGLDAIYAFDPAIVSGRGAVVLRPPDKDALELRYHALAPVPRHSLDFNAPCARQV